MMNNQFEHEPFLLRSIIDLIPSIIFVRDLSGKLILANKGYAKFFGLETFEIEGNGQSELYNKLGWEQPQVDVWLQEDKNVISSGNPYVIIETVYHRNGSVSKYKTSKFPLKLKDGSDVVLVISQRLDELE